MPVDLSVHWDVDLLKKELREGAKTCGDIKQVTCRGCIEFCERITSDAKRKQCG